jgi:hypothetical protein
MKMAVRSVLAASTVMCLISQSFSWAASEVHTLVLRQGAVPLLDGNPTGPAFTGFTDTYVDSLNPTTTYFTDDYVRFGSKDGATDSGSISGQPTTRGYLSVTGWVSLLPAGALVASAKLSLTSAGALYANGCFGSYLRYRTASFAGIDWNSASARFDNTVGLGNIGGWDAVWSVNNVQTVNITALAQQWHSGAVVNHGLQFVGEESSYWSGADMRFYSSEYTTDTTKRPTMTIQYITPGPTGNLIRGVQILSGTSLVQDTWIRSAAPTTPGGSTTMGNVEEWSNGQRVLLKVDTSNPTLANLALTGEPFSTMRPQLQSARLLVQMDPATTALYLWQLTNSWDANATWNTRDGSTAWSPAWGNNWDANAGPVSGTSSGSYLQGTMIDSHTFAFDVTALLQGWIDGGVNNGFSIGGDGGEWTMGGGISSIYLSEYSTTSWFQPMLLIETLEKAPPRGTTISIR